MTISRQRLRNRSRHERYVSQQTTRPKVQLPWYASNLWKGFRYCVVWGGRGGTRSWTVARALLLMAAAKRMRILCARELQSSIKDSVHQLLRDQIDLMQLPGFIVTDREIRHVNGSQFIFTGLRNNATKVKSLEGIDVCWVEEAERITKESWSILIPTIRKPGSAIWVTFNPDQETDATYQRFIMRPPKGTWSIKVGWEGNPWLSDELREEKDYAYATDPESADHVWGGNIRRISAAQIMSGKYRVESFTVPHDSDGNPLWDGPYHGVDFGYANDPATGIRLWVHDSVLYVEYEMWKLRLDIDDMPAQLMSDIPGIEDFTVRADSSRPDSINYLRKHGIDRAKKAFKHGGSIKEGIAHLRSYREIIIHPRCTHFEQECKFYSYKVDERSGDVLPIIVDKHNHLIDAARYALDPLIRRQIQAKVLFADDDDQRICPDCQSLLPDDGVCPHCGYDESLAEPESTVDVDAILAQVNDDHPMDTPVIDHRHANGNGNGHVAKPPSSLAARMAALRKLND